MIFELSLKDKHLIEKMEITPNALKILAIYRGYGFGHSFVRFYANESGKVVIAVKNGKGYLYMASTTSHMANTTSHVGEVVEFLKLITTSVLTEQPITALDCHYEEGGKLFEKCDVVPLPLENVVDSIETTYAVLNKVFPKSINSTSYVMWYTDTSHMIRHDVSQLFTVGSTCSVTVSINEQRAVLLSHLGTVDTYRGNGYATKLISHVVSQSEVNRVLLFSQNEDSDKFYNKIGFDEIGQWYYYNWR